MLCKIALYDAFQAVHVLFTVFTNVFTDVFTSSVIVCTLNAMPCSVLVAAVAQAAPLILPVRYSCIIRLRSSLELSNWSSAAYSATERANVGGTGIDLMAASVPTSTSSYSDMHDDALLLYSSNSLTSSMMLKQFGQSTSSCMPGIVLLTAVVVFALCHSLRSRNSCHSANSWLYNCTVLDGVLSICIF
jgi:hypothetical protein